MQEKVGLNVVKTLKRVLNIITTVIVAVVATVALCLLCMGFFGFHVYSVVSGSMEPEIHVGALIVVKDTDFASLKEKDVITYVLSNGTPCTHRIVRIDRGGQYVVTQGDANDVEDSPVYKDSIVGKVVVNVPVLGYIMYYAQNPPGVYIVIAVAALLIALMFIPDLFKSDDDKARNNANNGSKES